MRTLVCWLLWMFLVGGAWGQQASSSPGTVPSVIRLSGSLTDAEGEPLSGVTGVTFSLYKDERGGAPLWVETQNVAADKSGHYSVTLGSTATQGLPQAIFASGEARWLGVQPQAQAEQPRVLLVSVPYALKAGDAETVGGLPPSAFVKASSVDGTGANTTSNQPPLGGSGKPGFIASWQTATKLTSSKLFQNSAGNVGLGTATPAAQFDVNGTEDVRNTLTLFANGSAPTLTVNGTAFSVSNTGLVSFVSGQTFPGTGTITGVTTASGSGLTGGGTSGNLNLSLTNSCATNQVLQWSGSVWVCSNASVGTITGVTAGTDLNGGGTSGNVTLNLDTTRVPQLNSANTFTGDQTVNGKLSATGLVTGSSFQIGSNLFAFGSYSRENASLGFAGNTATTGVENTATGVRALSAATTGFNNTAIGYEALLSDTTGSDNTAIGSLALHHNTGDGSGNGLGNTAAGAGALESNKTGDDNTGTGLNALVRNTSGSFNTAAGVGAGLTIDISSITGSSNTFLGSETAMSTGALNNATAVGANAEVDISNAMVLGSINGVNGATASTNVGIGTTSPAATLDVHGTGNFTGLITFAPGQTFPGTGTITRVTAGTDLTGGGGRGNVTLNVDTNKVPQLNAANTFTGNQTVNGNLSATGAVTGSSFQIGSNLFAFGSLANNNAFLGFAGNATTTGNGNTATGSYSLVNDSTGFENTANGSQALPSNTTGNYNTATGFNAGETADGSNLSGSLNTFVGYQAAVSTGTLSNSSAIGANAEVSASNAMVLGSINGVNGATANTNVGIGTTAPNFTLDVHGTGNFTGLVTFASGQTFPGTGTVTSVGSGAGLVGGPITGSGSLSIATGGVSNVMLANSSLTISPGTDLLGGGPVSLGGATTLNVDTTKVPQLGTANVFAGTQTVGSGDLAINTGDLDLSQTTNSTLGVVNMGGIPFLHACCATTDHNTYAGANAGGFNNGNGGNNAAFGYGALQNLGATAGSNTAVGSLAMNLNTLGSSDVAVGAGALQSNTSGTNNTGVGAGALNQTSTGGLNTALGQGAGTQNTAGSNNTFIGANAGPNSTSLTFATAIGANATVGESNALVLGGTGGSAVNVGIGTATPTNVFTIAQNAGHAIADGWDTYSSRRWKTNIQTLQGALAKVQKLRGVSYDLKDSGKHEVGVIAEEIGAVVPEIVSWEKNGKDARGVDYSRLTALLIEATKEQQALIHQQQEQIKSQQAQLNAQQAQIKAQQIQMQAERTRSQAQFARLTLQVDAIQASLKANSRTDANLRTAAVHLPGPMISEQVHTREGRQ